MDTTDIPVIVLTGGPCAGKTTILSFLQQKLSDIGFAVITVNEVATDLILSGLAPESFNPPDFQRQVLSQTIIREDFLRDSAKMMSTGKKVLICDRGTMDSKAYVEPHTFDRLIKEMGFDLVELRDRRYDAVIFLRSVAVDAPDLYTCLNNNARKETVEQASELDRKTLDAWVGHPHLMSVDNSADIEGKAKKVFQRVCRVLGVPVPLEIEKKYLIKDFNFGSLPAQVQPVSISQYYLVSSDEERIRSRSQAGGTVYYHTIKRFIKSGVREEIERQITEDEYIEFLKRVDPRLSKIEKTRYCFVYENQYLELDLFHSPTGLVLLEVELTEEGEEVILPPFLAGVATDVTGDPRFGNYVIAGGITK